MRLASRSFGLLMCLRLMKMKLWRNIREGNTGMATNGHCLATKREMNSAPRNPEGAHASPPAAGRRHRPGPAGAGEAGGASTPAELAGRSEFIISILSNAEAIEQAYQGAQGLLSGDVGGKLFIEMSTVRPQTQRALAEK